MDQKANKKSSPVSHGNGAQASATQISGNSSEPVEAKSGGESTGIHGPNPDLPAPTTASKSAEFHGASPDLTVSTTTNKSAEIHGASPDLPASTTENKNAEFHGATPDLPASTTASKSAEIHEASPDLPASTTASKSAEIHGACPESKNAETHGANPDLPASTMDSGKKSAADAELRVVLLGCLGSGKSATANTLLGANVFRSELGASKVTTQSSDSRARRAGHLLQVVDTPALWEGGLSPCEDLIQLARCLELSSPGPHVFLYVTSIGQWSRQDQETVKKLRAVLGPDFDRHLVVVFTRMKELNGRPLHTYLDRAPPGLKDLLSSCSHRYGGLENEASVEEKDQQVLALLKIIEDVVEQAGSHFSNQLTTWLEAEKTSLLERLAKKLGKEEGGE